MDKILKIEMPKNSPLLIIAKQQQKIDELKETLKIKQETRFLNWHEDKLKNA